MPDDKIEIENVDTPDAPNGSIERNMWRCATRYLPSCRARRRG